MEARYYPGALILFAVGPIDMMGGSKFWQLIAAMFVAILIGVVSSPLAEPKP